MARTLAQWLDYQLGLHPQAIALGLDRVRAVAARLALTSLPVPVISVAGTNGKGSTVAFIEAIAAAAGYRVGTYTSPHILRYNERIKIAGREAGDEALAAAFEAVESARGDIALTFFEFGTLAALWLFARADLDLAVLEVGLGGRLDAVNLIDAGVSVITTIDLDHQAWLGEDREAIGFEKAGILRAGRPCILGERDPPSSVLRHAYAIGAFCVRAYSDYLIEPADGYWIWREPGFSLELPYPGLRAPAQLQNAACAIAALRACSLDIPQQAWADGVRLASLPGRLQRWREQPEVILDVAHNPQAAQQLADWLEANPRPTHAVFSALNDKDVSGMLRILSPHVAQWHVAALAEPVQRVLPAAALQAAFAGLLPDSGYRMARDVAQAYTQALADCPADGRVLVFGSFHTLEAVMRLPMP